MNVKVKDPNKLLYGMGFCVSHKVDNGRRDAWLCMNERWSYVSHKYVRKTRTMEVTLTQGIVKIIFPTDVVDVIYKSREKEDVYMELVMPE